MPSWFKKVFNSEAVAPVKVQNGPSASAMPATTAASKPPAPSKRPAPMPEYGERRVVHAPILAPEEEQSSWSEEIRIKARVSKDMTSCTLMVDRPVLDGLSAWLPGARWATDVSPLAVKLFTVEGVGTVLLHNTTVTITLAYGNTRAWDDLAAEAGAVIREHLKSGEPVVSQAFLDSVPPEEDVRHRIQSCIDLEVNPGIAAHSGVITLERVEGNTIFITMGGGCQGCAASTVTLRQGIHTSFRQTVPQIGAIYDETDHAAGRNPFYSELPAGMT